MTQPGNVYLISCPEATRSIGDGISSPRQIQGLYKIGLSRTLGYRFDKLQRASPLPLEGLWSVDVENPHALEDALHRLYAKQHDHAEWYWLTGKQAAWICALDEETIERLIEAREQARRQERRKAQDERNALQKAKNRRKRRRRR